MLLKYKANKITILVLLFIFIIIFLPAINFNRKGRVFNKLLPLFTRNRLTRGKLRGSLLLKGNKNKNNLLLNLLFSLLRRTSDGGLGLSSGLFNFLKRISNNFRNLYLLQNTILLTGTNRSVL